MFQSTLPTRGSDLLVLLGLLIAAKVSIHAPHEGERLYQVEHEVLGIKFQSTLPTRGSDHTATIELFGTNVSIHAPHEGERLW